MKKLIEALERDLNTVTDSGVIVTDYNFDYNKYCGYNVSVSFTYKDGEIKDLSVMLHVGNLPTPKTLLEAVTKVCLEFCEDQNQLDSEENNRAEEDRFKNQQYKTSQL